MISIQKKNQSTPALAAVVVVQVKQVLIIKHHQKDGLPTSILERSHLYHGDAVCLDQHLLVQMNIHVRSEILQVRNRVLNVSINLPNASVHPEGEEAVIIAVVDHHLLHIKRKDVLAQVDLVHPAVHQVAIILAVPVLVMILAVLCLAVVQSLDLHPYLGDGGRLAF